MKDTQELVFPASFLWGAATSAHQVEGAFNEDGKWPSVWDSFELEPGRIAKGYTARMSCDQYHRLEEDLDLMQALHLKAYRFSVSWPRVIPRGYGDINEAGLDYYDRLVDGLLSRGIEPFLTLYHWDLPQALQWERGGWEHRETTRLFSRYAEVVGRRLGDRVRFWSTHNEPGVALEAYLDGSMPPGLVDRALGYQVAHHILVSHGLAVEALRSACSETPKVGMVQDLWPVHPASDSEADHLAAKRRWELRWDWFLSPVAFGRYPEEAFEWLGEDAPTVDDGDMETIGIPLDFMGINYYSRLVTSSDGDVLPKDTPTTAMDWEVYPQGFYDVLKLARDHYGFTTLYVTENGAAFDDIVEADGAIHDEARLRYLAEHLEQVHIAITDGIDVRGYFAWSLLDNFEWCHGYTKRFGLVHVDFDTLERRIKDSGIWYAKIIEENALKTDGCT